MILTIKQQVYQVNQTFSSTESTEGFHIVFSLDSLRRWYWVGSIRLGFHWFLILWSWNLLCTFFYANEPNYTQHSVCWSPTLCGPRLFLIDWLIDWLSKLILIKIQRTEMHMQLNLSGKHNSLNVFHCGPEDIARKQAGKGCSMYIYSIHITIFHPTSKSPQIG